MSGLGQYPWIVIDLQEDRHWRDCPMCDRLRKMTHAVGWYCGPTHDEIGSVSTEYRSCDGTPAIVGGMPVCKECHDGFYAVEMGEPT